MAQLNVISAAQGRQAQEAAARPARRSPTPQRLRLLQRAVLLRLRRQLPAEHDPRAGQDRRRPRKKLLYTGGLTIHTTIDLRFQRAADNSVRHHVFPTDQAIGALAMVEPGTGDVKALAQSRPMGRDAKAGPDLPQLRRPAEVRRLRRLPGRARRSRRSCSPRRSSRASRSRRRSTPRMQVHIPMSQYRVCGGQHFAEHRHLGRRTLHHRRHRWTLYTGTQESVNTFFAQLELQTGLCEPYHLAQEMGIDARPTRATRAWCRRSPSASPPSARSSWPTPTRRSPPAACTATRAR